MKRKGTLKSIVRVRLSEEVAEQFSYLCDAYLRRTESEVLRSFIGQLTRIINDAFEQVSADKSGEDIISRATRITLARDLFHLDPEWLEQIGNEIITASKFLREMQKQETSVKESNTKQREKEMV